MSNLFFIESGEPVRLAPSYKRLMPKYCSTMYRILEWPLRWISSSVSLAVVESLRMMPSSILFRDRKSRLGSPGVALIGVDLFDLALGMTTETGSRAANWYHGPRPG